MDEPKSETSTPVKVKEAEHKLKEMSKRAKERKASTPRKPPSPKPKGWSNFNLLLAGGMGAGIFSILYLILRKPKEEWKFTPAEKGAIKEHPVPEPEAARPKETKPEVSKFDSESF